MQSIETIRSPKTTLFPVPNSEPLESSEKYIYKMTDGRNILAAKIFKEDGKEEFVYPRPYRVNEQIRATEVLKRTPLGIYVPEYMYPLVDEQDDLVGMAVRWEDGVVINELKGQHPLSRQEFDQFEGALLATIDSGIVPTREIICAHNVMFNPDRTPRLWIAECEVEEKGTKIDEYTYDREYRVELEVAERLVKEIK